MKSFLAALSLVATGSMLLAAGCTVDVTPVDQTDACFADNDACDVDSDCCSGICASDGFCGLPVTSCLADNEACDVDSDCCSDLCASDGYCGLP
jgi:hypothetical protein